MSAIIVSLPEKRFWSWQLKNREKDFWSIPFLRYMLFYKQHSEEIKILNWQRIKQRLSSTQIPNFYYLEIIRFLHPRYHPRIMGDILKMCERQVRLFKWGYMICGSGRRPDGGIDYMDAGWVGLRPLAGCLGLTVVFVWNIALREEFGLYFSRVFC